MALVPVANGQDSTLNYAFPENTAVTVNFKDSSGTSRSEGAWIGPFSVNFTGTPPSGFTNNPFSVYCVDLDHDISPPTTLSVQTINITGNTAPPGTDFTGTWAQLKQAAWLYDNFQSVVNSATGQTQIDDGAALQAAIWAVADGNIDGSVCNPNDNFFITPLGGYTSPSEVNVITAQANNWLGQLGSEGANGIGAGFLYQVDRNTPGQQSYGQDMLGGSGPELGGNGGTLAPEGSSLYLLVFGLAPLLWFRRFVQRRAVS